MRLHTELTYTEVNDAFLTARLAGRIDSFVIIDRMTDHQSRTHAHAFEIRLEWIGTKVKGDGRRFRNGGNYGADSSSYAATRDEWGHFIAEVFELDSEAKFGHYVGRDHFHASTRYAYGN